MTNVGPKNAARGRVKSPPAARPMRGRTRRHLRREPALFVFSLPHGLCGGGARALGLGLRHAPLFFPSLVFPPLFFLLRAARRLGFRRPGFLVDAPLLRVEIGLALRGRLVERLPP